MKKRQLDQLSDEDLMQLVANGKLDVMELLFDRYKTHKTKLSLEAVNISDQNEFWKDDHPKKLF